VAALPARLRDPLLLVGSGDYTYDEVAEMLGQPVGTVKWRVSDARRQLRTRLAHLGFGEPAGRVAARRGRQS
jgi:RNA polymerase sigma-70 factor (ECF subfamily)